MINSRILITGNNRTEEPTNLKKNRLIKKCTIFLNDKSIKKNPSNINNIINLNSKP